MLRDIHAGIVLHQPYIPYQKTRFRVEGGDPSYIVSEYMSGCIIDRFGGTKQVERPAEAVEYPCWPAT
jgi:hypothetical protein